MKRIFNSMFLMAGAVAVALNFASCKGDDGGDDNNVSYGEEKWYEEGDSLKYSVAFSTLNDDDNELSFKQKITFVLPEDASIEYAYSFKYEPVAPETTDNAGDELEVVADSTASDSTVVEKPEVEPSADKSDYPIVSGTIIVNCSNADLAKDIYEGLDSTDYKATLNGTKIECVWYKEVLDEMSYAMVVAMYEFLSKQDYSGMFQGGTEPDTTQNQQPVVVDTKNSVVVGIGDGARVFKTNHAYYNLAAVEGGDSTLVTLWFANYDFNKKERKPNVLTLSFVVSGKIESLEALPADTIGNVAISFKGNKPSSLDFSGFGSILVGTNSVEITDYVYSINTPVQPFSYTGTITKFDATNVEEEEEQDNPGHNGIDGNIQTVGNKVTLTLKNEVEKYTEVYEAEFVNDKCSNCTCVMEYSSEQYAKLVYETLKSEGGYTLNGKTIIADVTKDYKGLTKAEVETAFKALQDAYQSK
ncbi:MAG: hypothetical protein IKZ99_06525 [Salinivirgaceae bacterium]|nr:hypothetical protein [Salinivirgaceae bacterium]